MNRRLFLKNAPALTTGLAAITSATVANACTPTSSPRVNVKDFCAVGDGITDDTTAINNAIASLTNGGVVYFPPGKYKITSAITLKQNLTLFGESKDTTAILAANNSQTLLQLNFASRTQAAVEISGLQFNANGCTGVIAIRMTHPDDVLLSNLLFVGCSENVNVDRCHNFVIDNCRSTGDFVSLKAGRLNFYSTVTSTASDPYPYCFAVTIDNYVVFNTGTGVAGPAITLHRAVSASVVNILLNDANVGGTTDAIFFSGDCQGCSVIGGVLGAGARGVFFAPDATTVAPSFCTVTDVDIDQFQTAGIHINNGTFVTVSNCMITSSGAANSASGVLIENGSGFIVQATSCHGFSSGNGVLCGVNVQYTSIVNCQIWNCLIGIGVVSGGTATGFNITGDTFVSVTNPIVQALPLTNNLVRDNIGIADLI
jgi:hypothetical protein